MKGIWILLALLLMLLMPELVGCAAAGYEPGPMHTDASEVPLPGTGEGGVSPLIFKFTGERDTQFVIDNMVGDGIHWPSIQHMSLVRSASSPIGARGTAQYSVEGQRMEYAIAGFERAVASLEGAISRLLPIVAQYGAPATPVNTQPTAKDRLLELLLEKLESGK